MDANHIASSGTLISSSLESAGYYYQSFVLDALSAPFATSAGAFLYLVGAIAAIIFFITSGELKSTFWLLVAPGLFMSCIFIRTPTTGSKWVFGAEERDQEQVEKQIKYILAKATGGKVTPDSYDARISKLFAGYNRVISSTSNEFVRLINGDRKKADIMFIVRDQLFAAMNFSMAHDRGFIDLLHAGLMDNCGELLNNGQLMVDPLADSCNRCNAAKSYNKLIGQPYTLTSAGYDYVATLFVDYPTLAQRAVDSGFSDQTCVSNMIINSCGGESSTSCGGFFMPSADFNLCPPALMVVPTIVPELCLSYTSRSGILGNLSNFTAGSLMVDSLVLDAEEKFVEQRRLLDGRSFTCPQIWSLTYIGIHRHALEVYNYAISVWERLNGRVNFLGWCSGFTPGVHEVFELFAPWVGTDDPVMSLNQVARRLMKRELEKGSVAALEAQTVNQHSTVNGVSVPTESELSMIERSRDADPAWAERSRLLVSATTLPYYQGLGLFFLAIAFPFFAMLLLVPGKHAGFFLWFGLWAWLKSWDVAYSIVMLLSDALYSLFIVNLKDLINVFTMGLHPDMAVAIYSMRQIDPSYDLTTYYHILAICLLSIPSITGYLILGAFRGGQGLVSQGASMIPVTPKTIYEGIRGKEELIQMYEPQQQSQGNSSGSQNSQTDAQSSGASSGSSGSSNSTSSGGSASLAAGALAQGARSRADMSTTQADPLTPDRTQQPQRAQTKQDSSASPTPGLPSPQSRQTITQQSNQAESVYLEAPQEKVRETIQVKERTSSGWNDKD